MNEQTKLALINFTGLVATAIARQANGKDVDWREIVDAQETLATHLQINCPQPDGVKCLWPDCQSIGCPVANAKLTCPPRGQQE